MSGSAAGRYIEVPPTHWEPVPERALRATASNAPLTQKGEGLGVGASLVQYNSTTSTVPQQIAANALTLSRLRERKYATVPDRQPSDIAKDALLKLLDLPKDDRRHLYDPICCRFVEYLDRCEQKGFMVKGYDTAKGQIINLPMSYDNRWGPSRRKELSEKLKRLEYWFELQKDRPVTMVTLTSYHEGLTIEAAWRELNKSRGKLLKLIAKYFPTAEYFWVPEPHKSGYVHYHLAVFADVGNDLEWWTNEHGIDWYRGRVSIEDKFRDLWSRKYKTGNHTYGLDFSKKHNKDEKIKSLKNYLSKYLEKGFLLKEWSTGMLLFNAHLWETGFRMYGASKRIREVMNIKDDHDSKIVWLKTDMETVELTPENEEVPICKTIWERQYIPDWLDEPLWFGNGRQIPAELEWEQRQKKGMRLYAWGRPTADRYLGQHDRVTPVTQLTPRQLRAQQFTDWDDS